MVVIPHRGRSGSSFENEAICCVNWLILCFAPRVVILFIHGNELAERGGSLGQKNLNKKGLQMNWPFVVGTETRRAGGRAALMLRSMLPQVWNNCESDIFL